MASLSNAIERYLKELLERSEAGVLEVQRSELADRFGCVPSQISYVLTTRFTPERGYLVESRRGGGGFIRLIRLNLETQEELHQLISEGVGGALSQQEAEGHIDRLLDEGLITPREAALMTAVVSREVLNVHLPLRDVLRANVLRALILEILRFQEV